MFLSLLLPRYLPYLVLFKTRKIAHEGFPFCLADLQAYFARIVPSYHLISASKNSKMGSYQQLLVLLSGIVEAYWPKLYKHIKKERQTYDHF